MEITPTVWSRATKWCWTAGRWLGCGGTGRLYNYKRTSRREPLTFYIECSETEIPFPWQPGVHINSKEYEHIFTHDYR